MPISYTYDSDLNLIRTVCEGFVSLRDVLDHFNALQRDSSVGIQANLLLDLRQQTSVPLIAQLADVTTQMERVARELRFNRCGILADRERVYGVARMFQAMSSKLFNAVEVFNDPAAAESWLVQQ
ncbi:MAG: hypothetical protein HC809_02450 [Gammaproteobacteria bacterium]|nr:hypothetical protein [Gammaproteobacteria bacterium]